MNLKAVVRGISCWPDWAFSWTAWGRRLKLMGDAHDDWCRRACPKGMADWAIRELGRRIHLRWESKLCKWFLGLRVSWAWYRPEVWEEWSSRKIMREIDEWEAKINREVP